MSPEERDEVMRTAFGSYVLFALHVTGMGLAIGAAFGFGILH
jgi:hypothetical protein